MAANRTTGIVFDGRTLAWAALAVSGNRFVDSGRVELPAPDADATGAEAEARRGAETVERIRAACGRTHGDVVLGLGADCILLRVLDLPDVEDDELAGMAELQADKFAPFPLDSLVVSHEVLDRRDGVCTVLVAAAREAEIDAQGRPFVDAGLRPARIDAAILGTWRLLHDAGVCPDGRRCIHVLLSAAHADIILAEDGIPRLLRTLPLAAAHTAGVAAELRDELGQTLLAFELEHGARPAQVTVWGAAEEEPVAAALEGAGPWETGFRARGELPDVCRGLALRGPDARSAVDLTPRTWKAAEAARGSRRRMLAALSGVLLSWLLILGGLAGAYVFEQNRLAVLQKELAAWRKPALEVRDLRRRVLLIERYTDVSHSALECLREVSRLQPEGIELTSFSYSKADAVRLAGQATERNLIYQFKQALDGSGLFAAIELGSQSQDRRKEFWTFDVVLKLPGEAS